MKFKERLVNYSRKWFVDTHSSYLPYCGEIAEILIKSALIHDYGEVWQRCRYTRVTSLGEYELYNDWQLLEKTHPVLYINGRQEAFVFERLLCYDLQPFVLMGLSEGKIPNIRYFWN
jgi:hypothetical protein